MANDNLLNKEVDPTSVIEINDLDNLERLLRQDKLANEQYIHWTNGTSKQEAYLRIQELNGKRIVSHYDIEGRSIIPTMKERIENVLGVKPLDVSGTERARSLYNPGGFAADQPEIFGLENKREHALSVLQKLEPAQLNAMAAKAEVSKAAASGKSLFGLFGKKPQTEVAPEVPSQKKTLGS